MLASHRYYYLNNFAFAMDWIRERYGDLLDESERRFLSQFQELPLFSRALLVRLLLRRGPWFLRSKLAYDEIADLREAAAPLLELGFLQAQHPMALDELFAIHTKAELLRLFASSPIHGALRKPQMLDALRGQCDREQTYAAWNPDCTQGAWRVMVGELCERFRLMFFGNLHQSWSEFVLSDLGIFRYERVAFERTARVFDARADVDGYLAIHRCRQALDAGEDAQALLREAARCASTNPWLEVRRAKLLMRLGEACERAQNWALAQEAYAQSRYPGARHRRMRVYERAGRCAEALDLALAAHAAPQSEEESQRVARMLPRLRRKLGQGADIRAVRSPAATLVRHALELERPGVPTAVETLVRDHWTHKRCPVFYVENALVNSLFGLLFWPAIFAPLPGAFFDPFQSGPLDLHAPDFVQRRQAEFAAGLALLSNGQYPGVIRQRFVEKQGLQSPFVFWGVLTQELLDLALACIAPAHLRALMIRMLADIKANRTGFPDLVRFWPQERRCEFIEVKGPGDKLQDNQLRWLHYFGEHGMAHSVCDVRWRDAASAPQAAPLGAVMAGA